MIWKVFVRWTLFSFRGRSYSTERLGDDEVDTMNLSPTTDAGEVVEDDQLD